MPASVDQDDRAIRFKSGVRRRREPLKLLLADQFAVRLFGVLEGVVDDQDV